MTRKTSTLILLVAFLLSISVINCETDITDPFWTITGNVTDSLSTLPIDSAGVYIYYTIHDTIPVHLSYSDTAGKYVTGMWLNHSGLKIFCRKTGYISKYVIIDLYRNVENLNFQLVHD
jgi:hypothetical protein